MDSNSSSVLFFSNWDSVVRVLIIAPLAYIGLVAILRISGKRTLSKMNAFDLIVTVALGSTLATIILSKNVALLEGLIALALLIGLQYVVAWSSVRSDKFQMLVKSTPSLLIYRGEFLEDRINAERFTKEEVRAALRAQGVANVEKVEAAVLETDGSVTVIKSPDSPHETPVPVLEGVYAPKDWGREKI